MTDTDTDAGSEATTPVWAVFGDLMAGLLGAFVLILAAALGMQLDLSTQLQAEIQKRQAEQQRREALERALAIPLAQGRVTLNNGRIGISNSVLFAFNSDQLQPEGRRLLKSLAAPLGAYLAARDEILMVSGFTDDRPMRESSQQFADNWELSAQRALTVTRALDRRRRARLGALRRGLRRRATGGVERRRGRPRDEPPRGDHAHAAAVEQEGRRQLMSVPGRPKRSCPRMAGWAAGPGVPQ